MADAVAWCRLGQLRRLTSMVETTAPKSSKRDASRVVRCRAPLFCSADLRYGIRGLVDGSRPTAIERLTSGVRPYPPSPSLFSSLAGNDARACQGCQSRIAELPPPRRGNWPRRRRHGSPPSSPPLAAIRKRARCMGRVPQALRRWSRPMHIRIMSEGHRAEASEQAKGRGANAEATVDTGQGRR